MQSLRILFGVFLAAATFAAVACSVSVEEHEASSDDALTGSLTNAKACAVATRYIDSPLGAFEHLAFKQLPEAVRRRCGVPDGGSVPNSEDAAFARFVVPDVGEVFVVELESSRAFFYDRNGTLLVEALLRDSEIEWLRNGSTLDCASPPPPPPTEASVPDLPEASAPNLPPDASVSEDPGGNPDAPDLQNGG